MILNFLKSGIYRHLRKIKQIMKISIICEILNVCVLNKQICKEFDKLLRLYLRIQSLLQLLNGHYSTLKIRNHTSNVYNSFKTHSLFINTYVYTEMIDEENRQALFDMMLL